MLAQVRSVAKASIAKKNGSRVASGAREDGRLGWARRAPRPGNGLAESVRKSIHGEGGLGASYVSERPSFRGRAAEPGIQVANVG